MKRLFLFVLSMSLLAGCHSIRVVQVPKALKQSSTVLTGADQLDTVLMRAQGKRVALLVNQTAVIKKAHLADTLKSLGVNLVKIFSPEHGFRGTADAGEEVKDGIDPRTGIPVVSLYGNKNYKATTAQLADVDVVIFDIQDVGARFFSILST